jgi:nicotinate-nucleotide pyrophosphorylase (carboxylating)
MARHGDAHGVEEREVRRLVAEALREDGASNDVTTTYLGIGHREISAALVARAQGVIAGIDVARLAFEEADRDIRFDPRRGDGARVRDGDLVATLEGRARGILAAERTALNFLQRLSGVATLAAAFVDRVEGTGVTILDTRKTTPLLRGLEKYAVRVGGGTNHRFNLSDMLLVKENHIRTVGGIPELKDLFQRKKPPVDVEVEVDTIGFLRELLGAPINRVMLDNFSPRDVVEAVGVIAEYRRDHPGYSLAVEVSGGVDLANVRDYAVPGVDYISIGALTHSAPALNLSLEVDGDEG